MARSIHRTRREIAEFEQSRVVDSEERACELDKLRNELQKKRRIKRQVRDLRRSDNQPTPTPIETIPIQAFDESQYTHFPANSEDVRAVLKRLPCGTADGLAAVELRAGVEFEREITIEREWTEAEPDRLTGRLGLELMPGVYTPPVLGCYLPARGLVYLFAYVYDSDVADCEIIECFLRLQILSTFVHEVAHHYDYTFRVDRDRWRMDDRDKGEIYAENVQREWLTQSVIPYLETSCKHQVTRLQHWLQTHVGTEVPLHVLAGDPRATPGKDKIYISAFFDTCHAFEALVTMVAEEQPPDKIRVDFARELHYAEEYDVPERILKSVLDENPKNVDAIALTANIAEHRQHYSLALELAHRALTIERDHRDAFHVLTLVYRRMSDWKRLLQTSRRMFYACGDDEYDAVWALEHCALARFHQGRMDKFDLAVSALESFGTVAAHRSVERLRQLQS